MADAMLAYRLNESDSADFAIINAGGIRATIDEGSITRGEVLTLFPFGNSLVEISMSGDDLWNVLEGICTGVSQFNGEEVTSFFQISRIIEVEWNPENSNGTRLVSVTIGNASLDREETYNIVTLDFLAGGGDNFFPTPFEDAITLETQDEILTRYIQSQSPVDIELDRRITIVDAPGGGNGTTSSDATSTDNEADSNITTGDASTSTGGSSDRYLGTKLAFYLPLAAFAVMLVQL